eukprot:8152730-Ditylum_brightwellii.AAC.2
MVDSALEEQTDIGWDNFAKERVSKMWGNAQAECYKQFHPTAHYTTASWTEYLIKAIWNVSMDVLKARNAHLHNCVGNSEKASINKQVKRAFNLYCYSMHHTDQALFHMPLDEQMETTHTAKECWLK